jgi:hypothetical protein
LTWSIYDDAVGKNLADPAVLGAGKVDGAVFRDCDARLVIEVDLGLDRRTPIPREPPPAVTG